MKNLKKNSLPIFSKMRQFKMLTDIVGEIIASRQSIPHQTFATANNLLFANTKLVTFSTKTKPSPQYHLKLVAESPFWSKDAVESP